MTYSKIFDNGGDGSKVMLIDTYFSGGASSVVDMIDKDPNYGVKYRIRAAFSSSDDAKGIKKLEERGIKVVKLDQKKTYAMLNEELESRLIDASGRYYNADFKDAVLRDAYDQMVMDLMRSEPGSPDLICLSGYMRKLSPKALENSAPMINVHPARLSILTNGEKTIDAADLTKEQIEEALGDKYWRLLTGENVVSRAIENGYTGINASIHVVTNELDGGPLLVTSPTVVANADDAENLGLQYYSDEVQGLLKGVGDSPAFFKAIKMIADGRVEIDDVTKEILIDGKVPIYGGIQMGERYTVVADILSRKVSLMN